jgi:hypothetical protein
MSVNLAKSRNVFFPEVPASMGGNSDLFMHFTDLQDEMTRQVVGLFDNDAILRDALNTAVSVAVTAKGDMVYATGSGWGVLPVSGSGTMLMSDGTVPRWDDPNVLGIPTIPVASMGAIIFYKKTTGWAGLVMGSVGQELVLATTGPVWTSKDANIVSVSGATTGGMIVHSGGDWVPLAKGNSGQTLVMGASVPAWGSGGGWNVITTVATNSVNSIVVAGLSSTGHYRVYGQLACATEKFIASGIVCTTREAGVYSSRYILYDISSTDITTGTGAHDSCIALQEVAFNTNDSLRFVVDMIGAPLVAGSRKWVTARSYYHGYVSGTVGPPLVQESYGYYTTAATAFGIALITDTSMMNVNFTVEKFG